MPEGDSVANDALKLRPVLVGKEIADVYGTKGSVRSNVGRLRGHKVESIRTVGKNLVIDLDSGYSLHVHLGMTGRWRVVPADRKIPGSAGVALTTDSHHAACLGAPTVDVDRTPAIDARLSRLGPDLLSESVDTGEILKRARQRGGSLAEILLDQTVAAGVGNVYKSELAFLARLHPETSLDRIDDAALAGVYENAVRLLRANVGPGRRTTTGERGRGRETWVYGRAGRACRRCSARIESSGGAERVTYWCPRCQVIAS